MRLNIKMKDNSILNNVRVFYSKELDDSEMKTKEDFEHALLGKKTIFFGGKYVQGGFIPQQVKDYEYIESDISINDLQAFNPDHEKIANEIVSNILFKCNHSKGTSVQTIHDVMRTIEKYS